MDITFTTLGALIKTGSTEKIADTIVTKLG